MRASAAGGVSPHRGAVIVMICACVCYLSPSKLNIQRDWAYDDSVAVYGNPIVRGTSPFEQLWSHDFWGRLPVTDAKSMKSYRPLTTLTFRWEWAWRGDNANGFHTTNVLLHALVSALCVPLVLRLLHLTTPLPPEALATCSTARPTGTTAGMMKGGDDAANVTSREAETPAARLFISVATGLLFAAHPVHTESVSNVTGRNEVLMALFYLLGLYFYLCTDSDDRAIPTTYAVVQAGAGAGAESTGAGGGGGSTPSRPTPGGDGRRVVFHLADASSSGLSLAWYDMLRCSVVLVAAWASTMSKEPGFTLPIACAAIDLLVLADPRDEPRDEPRDHSHRSSGRVGERLRGLTVANPRAPLRWGRCGLRVFLLGAGCVVLALWRQSLNAGPPPAFFNNANRAAYIEDRYERTLGIVWIWLEHVWVLIYPRHLSPDWGADSVPNRGLHQDPARLAVIGVVASVVGVWAMAFVSSMSSLILKVAFGSVDNDTAEGPSGADAIDAPRYLFPPPRWRAAIMLVIVTFFPCSNVLVFVGATKAERWLYLPSFGYCLLVALACSHLAGEGGRRGPRSINSRRGGKGTRPPSPFTLGSGLLVLLLALYGAKTADRDREWSSNMLLWKAAAETLPRNCQALKLYSGQLIDAKAYSTAEEVLRRAWALNDEDRGIHDVTLHLTLTLWHLKKFDDARQVAEEGLLRIDRLPQNFGTWDSEKARVASLLAVVNVDANDAVYHTDEAIRWAAHAEQLNEAADRDKQVADFCQYARKKVEVIRKHWTT